MARSAGLCNVFLGIDRSFYAFSGWPALLKVVFIQTGLFLSLCEFMAGSMVEGGRVLSL